MSGDSNANAIFHHHRAIGRPRGAPPFRNTARLSSLLPSSPHPNQATHGPSKPNDTVVEVGVAQRRTWDSEVAEVGDELEVRSVPFSVVTCQQALQDSSQGGILDNLLTLHNTLCILLVDILLPLP